jgi:plastocyanin
VTSARRLVPAALLALVAGMGAARAAETVEVAVENRKFVPAEIRVKVGDTVKWVNREKRDNHSVWFREAGIEESERFFPGESWQYTFDKPGRYPYICGPHPEMTGVVEVTP